MTATVVAGISHREPGTLGRRGSGSHDPHPGAPLDAGPGPGPALRPGLPSQNGAARPSRMPSSGVAVIVPLVRGWTLTGVVQYLENLTYLDQPQSRARQPE